MAAELSGSTSGSESGLIGPLPLSDYSDEIQRVIASLEVGGITDPRRSPTGYQILRLEARTGHFFDRSLLRSQFEALEEPEGALEIDISGDVDSVVEAALSGLRVGAPQTPDGARGRAK